MLFDPSVNAYWISKESFPFAVVLATLTLAPLAGIELHS